MSDDEETVTFRAPAALVDALDSLADASGPDTTRSDLLRMGGHYVIETQADHLERMGELEAQESELVERNMKRRNIARFAESTIRGLFTDDLKGDVDATKLPRLADHYREQARLKEEMAQELDPENPIVEPGELVAKVDQELNHAIEAADLSNWYDQHENPYAADLSGVREGVEEREDLVALVAGLVETHASLVRAFNDPEQAPDIDPAELPPMAHDLLPEGKTKADVAELATELAREGYTAEQVRGLLDGQPLDADAINADDEPPALDADPEAVEAAEVRMGGQPAPYVENNDDDDEPTPDATDADADNQDRLRNAIASADGGRTPSARRSGWQDTEEVDDDMSHETQHDDDRTDDENDASARLDALDAAAREAAESAGGDADE